MFTTLFNFSRELLETILSRLNNINHLKENKMTYFQHLKFTMYTGSNMLIGSIAVVIHGIFPIVFVDTASNIIKKLHSKLEKVHSDSNKSE